jgi:hypothetical protein
MAGTSRRTFRALRPFSYGPNGRHAYEIGDLVHKLPTEYVGWMLEQGVLEEVPRDEAEAELDAQEDEGAVDVLPPDAAEEAPAEALVIEEST